MRGLLGLYRASKAWTQTSKVSPYIEARIRDSESKSPVCINFANAVTAAALTSPRESLRRALTAAMACGLPLITRKTMTNPYDDDDGSNPEKRRRVNEEGGSGGGGGEYHNNDINNIYF